jgi:gliding motility-associated-like protein
MLISTLLWFAPTQGFSQCNGSLGTPIFKETFGAGSSIIGPPLPAGTSDYNYVSSQCVVNSQYAIVSYTSGCADWHTLTDHTGDPGGYFMIVSAEAAPVTIYTRTIEGLCPGSNYEFSAWMANLDVSSGLILPDETFAIQKTDGTFIEIFDTKEIPVTNPVQWTKYAFDFTLPAGVSTIVVRLLNDYAPTNLSGGNNLAVDDIAFGPAGPSVQISANGFPGDTLKIPCVNSAVLSSQVGSCYVKNSYQWQISADNLSWTDVAGATVSNYGLNTTPAGTWFYRLEVAQEGSIGNVNCLTLSNTITVINAKFVPPKFQSLSAAICSGEYVLPSGKQVNSSGVYIDTLLSSLGCDSLITTVSLTVAAEPGLGKNRSICPGDTISLSPGGFNSYKWQDGSTNPVFTVTTAGTYSVTVSDSAGCISTTSVQINEGICNATPIPNTFTPNGDGINDTWNIPQLLNYPACTVLIFNRWGKRVFNSTGYSRPWDGTYNGKALPAGPYYYKITLHPNGEVFSGFVALLR